MIFLASHKSAIRLRLVDVSDQMKNAMNHDAVELICFIHLKINRILTNPFYADIDISV
jgi:hypothetical protein